MREQTVAIHAGYQKDTQATMAVPIFNQQLMNLEIPITLQISLN